MTDVLPPHATSRSRRVLRGFGALALALSLLVEPGLAAAGVYDPTGSVARPRPSPERTRAASPAEPAAQTVGRTADSIGGTPLDPTPADPADDPAALPDEAAPPIAQEPSIIALEAAAHEHDRIKFTPGDAVRVPFSPRPDDGWTVDGVAPRRLPAGAASGRAMAASPQGTVWAPTSSAPEARAPKPLPLTPGPVDEPMSGPAMAAYPASAVVTGDPRLQPPRATDLRRQVFGFLPYWELSDPSTRLNYGLLSTIAYFGVGADADGDLLKRNRDGSTAIGWAGWASARMASVIKAAHRHGTRVVLTVQSFAWTTHQADVQSALLGSATARLKLARQIAAAVRDRGADGVNLDFEPLVSGRSDEFVALVRTIRSELNRIARGYQLTFDTMGWIGNYPIEAATAPGAADAIFVMGYDYRTASSGSAGSIAPLAGPTYDLVDTVLAFTDRVPARKLILGLPYYGRAWSTVSDQPRSRTRTGSKFGWSTSVTYDNAVALAKKHGRRYDRRDASAWFAYKKRNCSAAGCVTTWREVYYDDAQSLRAKYDMINRHGLRGAGIWALGYDGARPELYRAIVAKFLHDTTAPETGIDILAARQGDEGFTVTWSAQDMNPIRKYDVQVSIDGGKWTAWLTGTKTTEAVMLGRNGHGYAFRARATDAKGNRGRWNIANRPSARPNVRTGGFATVKAATLTARSRPDTAAPAVTTLESGDVLAVTGGPVQADGYAWFRVNGPLQSWAPTEPVRSGIWVAGRRGSVAYLVGRTPPNTTIVAAGIAGLSFGAGGRASLGPSAAGGAARAFSPNGDGSEDRLALRWANGLAFDSMTLRVFQANGSIVGTRGVPATGRGSQAWAWDGMVGGRRLTDGRYVLQLIGRAGSRTFTAPSIKPMASAQVALYAVTIDTLGPRLTGATATGRVVSPPRDGRHDRIPVAANSAGATYWRLTAAPLTGGTAGAPVRTVVGAGGAPRTSWNGRTDAGTPARDGRYRLTVAVLDPAGNFKAASWIVVVDGTAPATVAQASPPSFSPNGDAVADATVIGWTTSEPAATSVRIYRGTKLIRTFKLAGARLGGAIRWTGRPSAGKVVGDGAYQARISVQDTAGNRRTTSVAVRVDRTAGWLRWAPSAFYPQDLDALARTAQASFKLGRSATSTLTVVDAAGRPARTAWSGRRGGPGTLRWTWNGRDGAGRMVAPGTYTLVLSATSGVGTTILRRSLVVDAFAVALSAIRLKPGRTLVVSFGTVERLSSRPLVTFDQMGRPPVTRFAPLVGPGRYSISFRVAPGGRGPAIVRISALDSAGRRNATSRTVTVQ